LRHALGALEQYDYLPTDIIADEIGERDGRIGLVTVINDISID